MIVNVNNSLTCTNFNHFRFRPINVKEMIHTVLGDQLTGKVYSSEDTPTWTKEISEAIRDRLKGNFVIYIVAPA